MRRPASRLMRAFGSGISQPASGSRRGRSCGCADRTFCEEEKDKLTEKKNAIYFSYIQKLTPGDVDPEICDVLRWLRESGVRLAIGSCSKNARTVLQKTGLRAFFDVVADGTMITRAKPDPRYFFWPRNCWTVRPQTAWWWRMPDPASKPQRPAG